MNTITVTVHLDYDVWDHRETRAVRVSRGGRPDVHLPPDEQAAGMWDQGGTTAHIAYDIASRIGLDGDERARARRHSEVAHIQENDPRWEITFEIA